MRVRLLLLFLATPLAACNPGKENSHLPEHASRVVGGAKPEKAPQAMRKYGCSSCHTIPGVAGANSLVGPPLAGFATREYIAGRIPNEPDLLVRWIQHPQSFKPGTAMPDMGVSSEDAHNIAAYLYELR